MVIKGEFPKRPPTLGETYAKMNSVKKDKKGKDTKNSKDMKNSKDTKKAVPQVKTFIADPLPEDAPTVIEAHYVLPSECEGVVNMQMAYIGRRKSELIRYIFKSKVFQSFFFGILSIVIYRYIGDYFSEYTFRNGIIEGMKSLFGNGFFIDDLIVLFFIIMIIIAVGFTIVKFSSGFLDVESKEVVNKFEEYFGCDLEEYARGDKKCEKFMKDHSFVINYRNAPIGFLIVKEFGEEIVICGYAVRSVYVKAEILKDLLGMMMRKYIVEGNGKRIIVELYNFEKEDIRMFKSVGFYKENSESVSWILNVFGVSKDIYKFDAEGIEW